MLKLNKHDATYLQNYYNKHGKENLVFHIIEECNQEILIQRELKRLNLLKYEKKLNEQKVKEIKKLISLDYSFKSIGNKYDVSESVISNINAGRMWKDVGFDNNISVDTEWLEKSNFLSYESVENTKTRLTNLTGKHGELKALSKELNIPYSKLIDIKRNKTWINNGL